MTTKYDLTTRDIAMKLDNEYANTKRDHFHIPQHVVSEETNETRDMVYLCGNSLGLQPKRTQEMMAEELGRWQTMGVEGHFKGQKRQWTTMDQRSIGYTTKMVGASADEIGVMNTLSVNLHILLLSFYQPTQQKYKIMMEQNAFCSDYHVLQSQLRFHGFDPNEGLIQIAPREGEFTLRQEDILASIEQHKDELALILLPGIQFYTGQLFDIKTITAKAHECGVFIGWDCAHAFANVPLQLHDWGVDFAAWCTYKYGNSGPGSAGGIFIHDKHFNNTTITAKRLEGWWGQSNENRFKMAPHHVPLPGAQAWQMSCTPVVSMICVEAGLEVFEEFEGGMDAVRARSLLLTGYLEELMNKYIINQPNANNITVKLMTPSDPEQRGAQLSLDFDFSVQVIESFLSKNGLIVDERKPRCIRFAPAPLYNTFADCWDAVMILKMVLNLPELKAEQQ